MTPSPASPSSPPALPRPTWLLALGQAAVLATLPHGGQRTARRNAWAGMSADSANGRARREADAALTASRSRAYGRAAARG